MSGGHDDAGIVNKVGEKIGKPIFGFNIFQLGGHGGFVDWAGEWGISRALICGVIFFSLMGILSLEVPNLPLFTLEWMVGTAPVWLPLSLAVGTWFAWVWYIQSLYLAGRKPILLEMKVPREITKSPRAMELAFTALSLSSGETTFIHRAWKGQVRPFFSFEIASFGGSVHFYIWCWDNYRETVETAIYSQYPEVELNQVEDYAGKFQYDPDKHEAWGVEWPLMSYIKGLNWTFEINAYPFRTYVDFELDKDPKEEFKIDPLGQILEFMSSIHPNEQLWVQFVMRKSGKIGGVLSPHDQDTEWKKMIEKEVDKVRAQAAIADKKTVDGVLEDAGYEPSKERPPQIRPSWRQQRMLETMERNLGKYPFEVGARGIYWTEGHLRGPIYTGFRWLWRPIGNPQYGTHLRPRMWHCDFDYPWQDLNGIRWENQTRRVHDAFRRRLFYHSPWILPTNVFTNEMLATVWHPPSRAVQTPGLDRIPATKSEPPPNLPI